MAEVVSDAVPAPAAHKFDFKVEMSCGGCSGAVNRALSKLPGVVSYEVSLESQTAHVETDSSVEYDAVLEKIKKTGKKVVSGEADGKTMDV